MADKCRLCNHLAKDFVKLSFIETPKCRNIWTATKYLRLQVADSPTSDYHWYTYKIGYPAFPRSKSWVGNGALMEFVANFSSSFMQMSCAGSETSIICLQLSESYGTWHVAFFICKIDIPIYRSQFNAFYVENVLKISWSSPSSVLIPKMDSRKIKMQKKSPVHTIPYIILTQKLKKINVYHFGRAWV